MITDKLFIDIVGDQKRGESLIRFAMKKLYELPQVRGQNTSRKIQLSGGEIVFVQHTDVRQEIRIFIPGGGASKKNEKKYEVVNEFGLFVFWGLPWEVLTVSNATKKFLPREAVVCGDGSGNTWLVQGNKLIGQYVKCWETGDTVKGMQSKAQAIIDVCNRLEYQYTYTSYSLWSSFIFKAGRLISSPADIFKRMCRDNRNREFRTHTMLLGSKYHGWLTLTAVENQELALYGFDIRFWFLCAKYNGKQVSFENEGIYSTSSVMRDIEGQTPILFDLFFYVGDTEEDKDETFYCGECHDRIQIRRFDKKTSTFKTVINNPVKLGASEILRGYANIHYYTSISYTKADGNKVGILVARDTAGEIRNKEDLADFDGFKDFLWNPSNEVLYAAYEKKQKQEKPDESFTVIECVGISQWVTGIWYECWYSCAGSYSSCSCWVCYDPSTACRGPNSFEAVEGSRMVGEELITWTVQIACCEDHAGNVMTFWTTYHKGTHYPPLVVTKPNDFIVTSYAPFRWAKKHFGGSVEQKGGSQVTQAPAFCFSLVDGVYAGSRQCTVPDDLYCKGEITFYSINQWVFTYDSHYLNLSCSVVKCDETVTEYRGFGNSDYAKFASDPPHDHNWTLIIKEGTEDVDGKPISPALFYTDADLEDPKVYYDTGYVGLGALKLAGPGNRAFCCADISTVRREVK